MTPVAVITGASRGIGRAVALRFARRKASMFLVADGTVEQLKSVIKACRTVAAEETAIDYGLFDLALPEAPETMVEAALRIFGRIDILVNNAGIRFRKPFGSITQADFEFVQAINLRAPFFASQAVIPAMLRQGGGRIINVASQMGIATVAGNSLYGLTKAAIVHLTRTMALELGKEGIVVNAVSPGPIAVEYNLDRFASEPGLLETMRADVPLGRLGDPDEVAEAIEFLAFSEGTFVSGHNLLIDGGYVLP